MKKVLLSAFAGLCIIGASVASSKNMGTRFSARQISTDTVPRDTTKRPTPDTTSPKMAYVRISSNLTDTVPKKDTTKPDTSRLAVAYVRVSSNLTDTVPKKDTTKPDTSRLAVVYVR